MEETKIRKMINARADNRVEELMQLRRFIKCPRCRGEWIHGVSDGKLCKICFGEGWIKNEPDKAVSEARTKKKS